MIDVGTLMQPVSPDSPCGANLEYDSAFGEMERAALGKPEQQFGATIIPAEEPNWRDVQTHAVDLLARTKDLRVAAELARADLALAGLQDFSKDLELIRGYLETFWDQVHPLLDPDDNNDPVLRVNTLESLCAPDSTLRLLRLAPLVSSRAFGRFNLRDVAVADGEVPPPAGGGEPADWTKINAAFAECPIEEISANAVAVKAAIDNVSAAQQVFADRVGGGSGVNLKPLLVPLEAAAKVYAAQLAKRGVAAPGEAAGADGANGAAGVVESQRLSGRITTREDVVLALDKVCEYYNQYEPSSPLPLLILRCKRLVAANFLDIIRDIIPDAVEKAEAIRGRQE